MENYIKTITLFFFTIILAISANASDLMDCEFNIIGKKIIRKETVIKNAIFTNDIDKFKEEIKKYDLLIKDDEIHQGKTYILYSTNDIITNISYEPTIQTLFIDLTYETRKLGYDRNNTIVIYAIACSPTGTIENIGIREPKIVESINLNGSFIESVGKNC